MQSSENYYPYVLPQITDTEDHYSELRDSFNSVALNQPPEIVIGNFYTTRPTTINANPNCRQCRGVGFNRLGRPCILCNPESSCRRKHKIPRRVAKHGCCIF